MTEAWDVWIVFGVLIAALVLFIGGWWRYDVVALLALIILTIVGIVPSDEAFAGFGHPAVITVAAILVISRGLINAGVINPIARLLSGMNNRPGLQVAALTALIALFSGFMNNIGAMALFMPVAIVMARKSGQSPSLLLMPLAFGSLLGGLLTLIGTPPNIIIATFRAEVSGEPFRMFDFLPVGIAVAVAGVLFISLIGRFLIPQRQGQASPEELFDISEYLVEVEVPDKAKVVGQTIMDLNKASDGEVIVAGVQRNGQRILAPSGTELLRAGDILTIEIDPESLQPLLDSSGMQLAGSERSLEHTVSSERVKVIEAVISTGSMMINRSVQHLQLRRRHGINMLAAARQGQRLRPPLRKVRFQAGDVLLMQVDEATMTDSLSALGCLPLADRELKIGKPRRLLPAMLIFITALLLAAFGVLAVQVAFAGAALLMVATSLVTLRGAYDSIDWSIIVLLGAMIPVGTALETTGAAAMIADGLLGLGPSVPRIVILATLLVATMFLSDVINNAAAAVLMAPIGIGLASGLEASSDPFLMAVAIGASCAFLTPIGHQSNTLVMGPGGYRFGDYWRMGLPLEIVIVLVAVPMISWVWPM
jgi:di/tricarboxylate transporter